MNNKHLDHYSHQPPRKIFQWLHYHFYSEHPIRRLKADEINWDDYEITSYKTTWLHMILAVVISTALISWEMHNVSMLGSPPWITIILILWGIYKSIQNGLSYTVNLLIKFGRHKVIPRTSVSTKYLAYYHDTKQMLIPMKRIKAASNTRPQGRLSFFLSWMHTTDFPIYLTLTGGNLFMRCFGRNVLFFVITKEEQDYVLQYIQKNITPEA